MAGNMRSRWTDFLASDGEKPDRMRDGEFEDRQQSRAELLAEWEHGWQCVFNALTPAQQKTITDVGVELEAFATQSAKEDDDAVAAVYRKVNAKVVDMDDAVVNRWRKIAEDAAWTDFAKRNADCERFLKLAKAVT